MPAAIPDARDLLLAFDYISMDDEVVDMAMNEPDRMLRSLDAIHLATARYVDLSGSTAIDAFVAYDARLLSFAEAEHFDVISPGVL